MSTAVVLVLVVAGLAAGGAAGVVLSRRSHAHPGLQQLLDTNRAILEQERVRSAQELDGRQQLIGHELGRVSDQMAQLDRMLRELETDRRERFGELATEL
ncbi:MAG TPA: hypothetical protein VFZ83_14010, partial [Acidimicrobiia bacterium]|nr:hypothetical protein [Acidimicrobiia bacterium]